MRAFTCRGAGDGDNPNAIRGDRLDEQSLQGARPSPVTAEVVLRDLEVLTFSGEDRRQMMARAPGPARALLGGHSDRIRTLEAMVVSMG